MVSQSERRLIAAACAAVRRAYDCFSKFRVGAALLALGDKMYRDCDIENASSGRALCAERVVIFNTVAPNEKRFRHRRR